MMEAFIEQFLLEHAQILSELNEVPITELAHELRDLRSRRGRLFVLGVGGGAANASHAVADFRKFLGIEAYAPTDNIPELTAKANDDGWPSIFEQWLATSHLNRNDLVLVLSVYGGDKERGTTPGLIHALDFAKVVGAKITGIVGSADGHTAKVADILVFVPAPNPKTLTPHTEVIQALVCHLLAFHPEVRGG